MKLDQNDGQVLLDVLSKSDDEEHIFETFSKLRGEYSFIYYQVNKQKIWFSRDILGRRSLLCHVPISQNDSFVISSVSVNSVKEEDSSNPLISWEEISVKGLYSINIHDLNMISSEIVNI